MKTYKIFYNDQDILANQPIPFLTYSDEYTQFGFKNYGVVRNININGTITGNCSGGLDFLYNTQENLVSGFLGDCKQLQLKQYENNIFEKDLFTGEYIIVNSIDFPESKLATLLNYSISLTCYPPDYWLTSSGILNPSRNINITDNGNGTKRISQSISAQSIYSGLSGLNVAKEYVNSLTGASQIQNIILTHPAPIILSITENENRLLSEYSINMEYLLGKSGASNPIINNNSTVIEKGYDDQLLNVKLESEFLGGINYDISGQINNIKNFDFYSYAQNLVNKANLNNNLNPKYKSYSLFQDNTNNIIRISVEYDDDPRPETYILVESELSTEITDLSTFSVNIEIGDRGAYAGKWNRVLQAYSGIDPINISYVEYGKYDIPYPLNPFPTEKSETFNSFDGRINIRLTFDNADVPPSGFEKFIYTVEYKPTINKFLTNALLYEFSDKEYSCFRNAYKTLATLSINGNATALFENIENKDNIINYCKALQKKYENSKMIMRTCNVSAENNLNYSFTVDFIKENPD